MWFNPLIGSTLAGQNRERIKDYINYPWKTHSISSGFPVPGAEMHISNTNARAETLRENDPSIPDFKAVINLRVTFNIFQHSRAAAVE